jgi:hypothetical protein
MTVAELIAELQKQPPLALVLTENAYSQGCLFMQVTTVRPLDVARTESGAIARFSAERLRARNNVPAVVLG